MYTADISCKLVLSGNQAKVSKILSYWRPFIIIINHKCEGRIENSVPRIASWHHECWQTVIPRDGFFHPTLTRILDSFSSSPLFLLAHLSRRLPVSLWDGTRVGVCASTLSNMNSSETSWPIAIKFHLEHYWGGRLSV